MAIIKPADQGFRVPSDSEVKILSHVLRTGGATQPDIVKRTDLSQQTVSRLVNELVGRGALALGDRRSNGRRGQPRVDIEIAPDYAYSLGVALMTDAMSVLLMDFAGNVVDYDYLDMPVMSRSAVFSRIGAVKDRFLAKTPHAADRLAFRAIVWMARPASIRRARLMIGRWCPLINCLVKRSICPLGSKMMATPRPLERASWGQGVIIPTSSMFSWRLALVGALF